MTPTQIFVEEQLQQLLMRTQSDLTAIGVLDRATRKIQWYSVYGSVSNRTQRIRQQINIGLTGEVLRTGRFLQTRATKQELFDLGESIMMTEKLLHAAAWPIIFNDLQIYGTIFIGKRNEGNYNTQQIEAGTEIVHDLANFCAQYFI
ncbi:MAG: GAF domain-containing protein [Candidatus Pristimantibacillus lignocellulolyticus]|uniref:GAF domain-containing protein n=1 Tax=Candidatus Pristimantibacillus lignocellulolyticus TaxID=2994561 RepID=A0A9J6ZF56_9BACL|nr:MAG: GAF domain-containing protein [Candidatus Pristimantibacillus lignocellulolyticus]